MKYGNSSLGRLAECWIEQSPLEFHSHVQAK
jgi:hypothetical protein